LRHISREDVVTLKSNEKVRGFVVRWLERGVLMQPCKGDRVVFVPKEHVQAVEYDVPLSEKDMFLPNLEPTRIGDVGGTILCK
jgi:hypothetical protein